MPTEKSIVSSAADSCSQPSSIRLMDKTHSSRREQKETFMFSNRSSITRSCSIAAATLAAVACFGLAGTVSATVIYHETFTGSTNAGTLNGATPNTVDTGNATWAADSSWSDSGYSNSGTNARLSASLPFTPVVGQIYTLSEGLDVLKETDPNDKGAGDYWLALGFLSNQATSGGWDGNGQASPWVLNGLYSPTGGTGGTNNTNGAVFTGPSLAGGQGFGNVDITAGVNNGSSG